MKFFKKFGAGLLCLALCFMIMPRFVRAATVAVDLSQDTFSDGDVISIDLTVTSQSPNTMENLSLDIRNITDNNDIGQYSFGGEVAIAPYETTTLTVNDFTVTEEMLNSYLEFTLNWTENGSGFSATAGQVHISREDVPEEQISFICYTENGFAENGEAVKIIYEVTNNSSVDMTDITITDSNLSSTPVVSGGKVAAGDRKSFTYEYTMGNSSVSTDPIMSYKLDGEIRSLRGNSITIESVTVDMDVSITQQDPTAEGTEFIIRIANNGNKVIKDIRVIKNESDRISEYFDLGTGEEKEISYTEKTDTSSTLSFKVLGTLATGEEYVYTSPEYTVWAYIDPATVKMDFSLEVKKPLNSDGYVEIDFTAKNSGTVDMTDIVITEDVLGEIGKFSNLAAGGKETLSLSLYVGDEPRSMNFTLTALAPSGEPLEYKQRLSSQDVSLGTGEITANNAFDVSKIDVGGTVSSVFKKILTVFGILSGLCGVALIVLSVFEIVKNQSMKKEKEESA